MAVEAAASGAALGLGLFTYNQGNYLFDAAFRFERFSTGRDFACQQMDQYRNDLRQLTAFTQKKTTMYAVLGSLCMGLCIALYAPGRLGMTGPETPGWILGLWVANNAAAFAFMILAVWLAIHASFRSQAASVHLLTRKARAPVPTLRQLDRARRFSSEFEQQRWGDIFRVPYLCRSGAPRTEDFKGGAAGRARSESPRGRPTPAASSWVRDEFETDRAGTVVGLPRDQVDLPADITPEHFRLFAQAQREWYAYEVYARVCLLMGFLSFVHALAYFGLGYIIMELRALWAAWACVFVLATLQALLLKFDVIERLQPDKDRLPRCQWLGPLAVLPAALAMAIDFRVQFSMAGVAFTWLFILLTYGMQLVYTLRLLELVLPDEEGPPEPLEERVGAPWWPETWRVPSSFRHVLYLVVPPSRLQPGQHDLVRDVKEGAGWGPADPTASATSSAAAAAPMSPAAAEARPPLTQEELAEQVQYLDRLFEWAFSDEVFNQLSQAGQQKVREIFHGFSATRSRGITPDLGGALEEVAARLGATIEQEGLPGLGAGEASGGESPGAASSGGEGGESSGAESGRSGRADRRRPHGPVPPFMQTRHIEPWRLVSLLISALAACWAVGLFGCFVDVFVGEQGLASARSRPPMTRLNLEPHELATPLGLPAPAGSRPLLPEELAWQEQKAAAGRKLQEFTGREPRQGDTGAHPRPAAGELATTLRELLRLLPAAVGDGAAGAASPATLPLRASGGGELAWPGFFEPQLLACGPAGPAGGSVVAALTPRGFGAVLHVAEPADGAPGATGATGSTDAPAPLEATVEAAFRLEGVASLPPLVGASWGPLPAEGLLLITRAGDLLSCPGSHGDGGRWACAPMASRLPVAAGGALRTAAAALLGEGALRRLHVALVDASVPDMVGIFKLEHEGEASSWLPLGEAALAGQREPAPRRVALSFHAGDLLVSTDAGRAWRQSLKDGAVRAMAPGVDGGRGESWFSSCLLQHTPDSIVHLSLLEATRRPQLAVAALADGDGNSSGTGQLTPVM